jgi:hypothetical protein
MSLSQIGGDSASSSTALVRHIAISRSAPSPLDGIHCGTRWPTVGSATVARALAKVQLQMLKTI